MLSGFYVIRCEYLCVCEKSVLNSVGLVPSWVSWVSCHRAIVPLWVRKVFRGYLVGSEYFPVGISWVSIFFSWVFCKSAFPLC